MNSPLLVQNMPDLGNFFQPALENSDLCPLSSSPRRLHTTVAQEQSYEAPDQDAF